MPCRVTYGDLDTVTEVTFLICSDGYRTLQAFECSKTCLAIQNSFSAQARNSDYSGAQLSSPSLLTHRSPSGFLGKLQAPRHAGQEECWLLFRLMNQKPCPPAKTQVAQRIPGRAEPSDPGNGHCDAVLCIDAHPTRPMLVSAGHKKDRTAKLWEHQPLASE